MVVDRRCGERERGVIRGPVGQRDAAGEGLEGEEHRVGFTHLDVERQLTVGVRDNVGSSLRICDDRAQPVSQAQGGKTVVSVVALDVGEHGRRSIRLARLDEFAILHILGDRVGSVVDSLALG